MNKKAEMGGKWVLNVEEMWEMEQGKNRKLQTGSRFERVLAKTV